MRISLPPEVYPLFTALATVSQSPSAEAFAVWCITKGMTSEEVMQRFDELVNQVL